jgi:hypothetical protein
MTNQQLASLLWHQMRDLDMVITRHEHLMRMHDVPSSEVDEAMAGLKGFCDSLKMQYEMLTKAGG